MRVPPFVFAVCFMASTLAAWPASAEPVTSALSWVRLPGAESCVATPELGTRVERHLGRPVLVSPSVAAVSIEGRVARVEGAGRPKYRAVVGGTRRDGTPIGTREIVSQPGDCSTLDEGLVLVIALMIDPNALAPAPSPDQPAAEPPLPPALVTHEIVHERVVVREVERVPTPAAPWLVQGSLAGVASIARLPGAAPGMSLALRSGPSRLVAFELSFGVVPSATLEVDSREVAFSILEGGLAYCPVVALGSRVDVGGCAGLRLGAIRSQGQGFAADHAVDRGLADVGLGPRMTVDVVGPVFVVAQAMALVPLVRQETTVTNAAGELVVLDRRNALGGDVGIGAGVRFSP